MRNLLPATEAKAEQATISMISWLRSANDPSLCQSRINDAEFILTVLEQYQKELRDLDIVAAQMRIDNDILRLKIKKIKEIVND